jgi:hypothetical protein
MGYFRSLAEAQKWAQTMRARFPQANAERVPPKILERRAPVAPTIAPIPDVPVMTDTQVLRVLEARRFTPVEATVENDVRGISLVGPDDTRTLRVLKNAVIQGALVQFAVQMFESAADIDLTNVPSLPIFRHYTLYRTTVARDGRNLHCLRLGFFKDAISAKQVAYFVQSHFAAVSVVPVTEPERQHAAERPIHPATLSGSLEQSADGAFQKPRSPAPAPGNGAAARPMPPSRPATSARPAPTMRADSSTRSPSSARSAPPKRAVDDLERTLELLAASETWNDEASLSETGVRHLKVEVQTRKVRR